MSTDSASAAPASGPTAPVFGGFEGRVAVVTGAGRGIGRAVADALVARGARTAYLDLAEPEPPLDAGERGHFVHCDVTDEISVDAAFTTVEETWGTVSILVNNAGIFWIRPLAETSLEAWNQMMAVNTTGAFLCARRVLPAMRAQRYGRLVALGSSAGKTGGAKETAAYGASKAAIMALAKSIATEYAADGITSNALAPALINTDMVAGIADLAGRIPVGRLGEPADIAAAVVFLASEEAGFITGEVMDINGGFLID
ncbi:MAG: SDR family NAD(P)-dependent oxidoreductase [bacterium]|nr:SDR family NAD(P)-dependent oxidoreductase [bacterium]